MKTELDELKQYVADVIGVTLPEFKERPGIEV